MPNPKDPAKLAVYRETMRRIALARGYGKWMRGKKHTPESIEKMRAAQVAIAAAPGESDRRSAQAKSAGSGKWMAGRPASARVRERAAERKGKTYKEIYGDRAEAEALARRAGNRKRWAGVPRKPQREKHNGDYRYGEWRRAVFVRDQYACQICSRRGGVLEAHHIKRWADHPGLRFEVGNGLTVHKGDCHAKAHKLP